jgi:GT2 family glycosyltransferase
MDVSVIIVNFNTKDLTINCIQSIYDQTEQVDYEIIVVDNASIDGSVAAIKNKFPKVILLESPENLGFGKANNLAARTAKGEFLFFLNSDTLLLNNAIKIFCDAYYTLGDQTGCMGTILWNTNHEPIHSFGIFPTCGQVIGGNIRGRYLKIQEKIFSIDSCTFPLTVDYITGADLFVPASLFKSVGQFDESFFMYFEETDLQKRIVKLGLKNRMIDEAHIVHLAGGSFRKQVRLSNESTMMIEGSMFYYLKKHNASLIGYLLFRFGYLLVRIPHLFNSRYAIKDQLKYLNFLMK